MKLLTLPLLVTWVVAQGPAPAPPTPAAPAAAAHDSVTPAPAPAPAKPTGPQVVSAVETQDDEAHQIGKMLRCPVCQGMPIAESPSQMAIDMMTRVREMLAEGKQRAEILEYFTTKYGEWVLLRPKAEGMNLGLWILPLLALLIGAFLVLRYANKPLGAESGASPTPQPNGSDAEEDEYIRAIRDEVNQ